ncbi:MAG: hypothetical protein KZQ73_00265 [Candidatus Thiodiazotropha sp. (ex Semelilucina semeliformis)]|nr:hypothetical protein [Candidatus Thiodiazotropha sp. (ex Semelilucina semeliformis)]
MSLLVFLDFDGVLHPITGGNAFDVECLDSLRIALDGTSVNLVISSSWREQYHFEELQQYLAPLNAPVIGVTPVIDDPFLVNVRYYEVMRFLESTEGLNQKWLAIDDTPGFYPADAPVYWTDSRKGFTSNDIDPLKQMLKMISTEKL